MELFDSHAHYNDEKFEQDKEEVLKNIYETGVTKLTCVGYNEKSSEQAIEIAKTHDFIYATVGISPNDIPETENEFEQQLQKISKLAQNPEVVAIGEIGLDYYWNKDNKEQQKNAFIKQIELANNINLPIVIHTREAVNDTLEILKEQMPAKNKGIFHCCPLNQELIKQGLKLGFYISFAGPITFKNSKNAEEVIKQVPLEKILIETDSPYLAPEPKRGTRNDSRNVIYIAEKIALVKGIPVEEVAKATYQNAEKIFQKK